MLDAWRKRQSAERLASGSAWINSGRIFTHEDGSQWHPAEVTKHFNDLVQAAGLPPIRLHDLRHGAATLALEAGVDIKVVQEELGTPAACSPATPTPASRHAWPKTRPSAPQPWSPDRTARGRYRDGRSPFVLPRPRKADERPSESEERPSQNGCAARDSNPEPAD